MEESEIFESHPLILVSDFTHPEPDVWKPGCLKTKLRSMA